MHPEREQGVLAAIFSNETYVPSEPSTLDATGLPVSVVESLICKRLSIVGTSSGRRLADDICIPFRVLERVYGSLRARQLLVHQGSAPLNDYNYMLTEQGRKFARAAMQSCSYVGPAPVPLVDYVLSTEAQTIRAESPKRAELRQAFKSITVEEDLFERLGPAINSGAGLFLYGEPGNGKSTLAKRITMCFGQQIWVPHAIIEDGQIIKLFDAAFHEPAANAADEIVKSTSFDPRWIKIKRPTVVVGGELTMDALEIRHDRSSNVSEASLQMKSNCGCLLVDDFGRQRIEPEDLLNRWIVPLESRVDYLTLSTGKKIQVPFEQLIIFSTNLEPSELVDEAFLRRIPYKVEIEDPSVEEFQALFHLYSQQIGFEYRSDVVLYLIEKHYRQANRRMRRCHPRDLLSQIRNYCVYNELPLEMRQDYFDRVVGSYFTNVLGESKSVSTSVLNTESQPGASSSPVIPSKPPFSKPVAKSHSANAPRANAPRNEVRSAEGPPSAPLPPKQALSAKAVRTPEVKPQVKPQVKPTSAAQAPSASPHRMPAQTQRIHRRTSVADSTPPATPAATPVAVEETPSPQNE